MKGLINNLRPPANVSEAEWLKAILEDLEPEVARDYPASVGVLQRRLNDLKNQLKHENSFLSLAKRA